MRPVTAFLEFLDRRSVFRRVAFVWMMWLTTQATFWCFSYASAQPSADGMQTAAVIGAVMLPISGLQAAVVKFYSEHRQECQQDAHSGWDGRERREGRR